MTLSEFKEKIEQGKRYAILDDLVVDLGPFINNHPGGKFLLQHNIGRDISKFFYGGYSLESKMKPYTHSNYAK